MEFSGRFQNIAKDWQTGQFQITFTINEPSVVSEIDNIKDCEKLSVKAVKYRQKRSLDANAYHWLLVTKIAGVLKTSTTEVHNHMLSRYGQVEIIDGSVMTIILLDSIEWQKLETLHLKPTTRTRILDNGKLYRVYYVVRGSHTYNTQEMSQLIDGVVSEAKELGIETLTPDELARMKSAWKGCES